MKYAYVKFQVLEMRTRKCYNIYPYVLTNQTEIEHTLYFEKTNARTSQNTIAVILVKISGRVINSAITPQSVA